MANDRNGKPIVVGLPYAIPVEALGEYGTDYVQARFGDRVVVVHAADLARLADITDHGSLVGLADNDHPQYVLGDSLELKTCNDVDDALQPLSDEVLRYNGLSNQWEIHTGLTTAESNIATLQSDTAKRAKALVQTTSDTTVANTTTETDVWSYSVSGGTLGTVGVVDITLGGTAQCNPGSNQTVTLRGYYGATKLWDVPVWMVTSAVVLPWVIDVKLCADGATNAQVAMGLLIGPGTALTWLGLQPEQYINALSGTSAEDSTSAKTLRVSAQWSLANTACTITRNRATAQLIPAP